jgi:hypothetical protein
MVIIRKVLEYRSVMGPVFRLDVGKENPMIESLAVAEVRGPEASNILREGVRF